MLSIAILGHGVVGSGVAEILTKNRSKLFASLGEKIHIKYILDLKEFPDNPLADRFTKDYDKILKDRDVQVVVEVMGGTDPAYKYVKDALKLGKNVVTSNKELVAAYGAELLQIASDNNANFLFEASVGGGVPIVRPIDQCLVANNVDEIAGILNGTTNFILTKMIKEGMKFDDALKLAQELGYAELDPSTDVDGDDASRKICILSSLAFGRHVYPEWVHTEGIRDITIEDVEYASAWGGNIKLIGRVKVLNDGTKDIIVAPMFIPNTSQLANIDNEFNGIMVRGDCTGDVVFYGKGAGKFPTASAVVADIVDVGKHLNARKHLFWADGDGRDIIDYKKSVFAYYLRTTSEDVEKAYNTAKEILGDIKKIEKDNAPKEELAFTTLPMSLEEIEEKIETLKEKGIDTVSFVRIGNL